MDRVRPVVVVLGSEQYGSLEDQLVSHWGSTFNLQFRSHFMDEEHRSSIIVDLNKKLIPSEDWVKRWTEERPSVVVDVLDQADQAAVSLAQATLKASGISYYVLSTSTTTISSDWVYPLIALPSLKEAILESCLSFYKEKARRYRKWVSPKHSRFPAAYGSLVRYNVKAGWMEELAMDLPSAVRAYHVAYSALVEAAKSRQGEGHAAFLSSTRMVSDYLARRIVCGLARSGSAREADAYLRNHHSWSLASVTDQMANMLAVAESFPSDDPTSPLIPGHYYLQAINMARSAAGLDLAHLRSMLTLAFDSYKSVNAKRHLIYIGLLSADLFEHGQNMRMLSQAVRDEKWDCMAALMLRGLTGITVQSAWFGLGHTKIVDEEGLVSCLEGGSGTIQFGCVQDTHHLPCAMRFLHKSDGTLRIKVTLCNMSPIVLSLDTLILSFKEGEEITIHAAEEIIPGAAYSIAQSVYGPDRPLRLAHVRLLCGSLCFVYSTGALCTVETLYLLPTDELVRWNRAFLRSLKHYWERSKLYIPRPCEVTVAPLLTCSATSTLATRVPVKFAFHCDDAYDGLVQILGCDHGTCEAMSAPFQIDDGPIEITWTTPGTKSILFRCESGEAPSFCQQFSLVDPFKFSFALVRRSLEVCLLTVDLTVQVDGISLTKWDLWDSSSGAVLSPVNSVPSKETYLQGDVLRAGFILDEPHGDLVFRIGWATETLAQCTTSEPCPSHILAAPAGLMLAIDASSLHSQVGERIQIKWTLKSHLDTPSIPLTMTISDHTDQDELGDSWVYEGPCNIDLALDPGQSQTVEAWIVGLLPGRLALPIVTVTPTNPAHAMHPITTIDHPSILITNVDKTFA